MGVKVGPKRQGVVVDVFSYIKSGSRGRRNHMGFYLSGKTISKMTLYSLFVVLVYTPSIPRDNLESLRKVDTSDQILRLREVLWFTFVRPEDRTHKEVPRGFREEKDCVWTFGRGPISVSRFPTPDLSTVSSVTVLSLFKRKDSWREVGVLTSWIKESETGRIHVSSFKVPIRLYELLSWNYA